MSQNENSNLKFFNTPLIVLVPSIVCALQTDSRSILSSNAVLVKMYCPVLQSCTGDDVLVCPPGCIGLPGMYWSAEGVLDCQVCTGLSSEAVMWRLYWSVGLGLASLQFLHNSRWGCCSADLKFQLFENIKSYK